MASKSLLVCPKNLRECIDWVLRATGKDIQNGPGNINNLKDALEADLGSSLKTDELETQLNALASGLEKFIGYDSGQVNGSGIGSNGTGGPQNYSSSYNPKDATWENLCQNCQCKSVSNSSSHSCPSCGSQTVCSDPSQCCADCDVRKAAKIFLGMLPCLYYALKYLYDKCEVDWNGQKIIKDSSLGRFLVGMGFELQKLDGNKTGQNISTLLSSLFNGSNGSKFKDLYEKSKNYFTSRFTSRSHVISSHSLVPSSDSKTPSTVREILLWLSGLPFTSGFEDLLDHCKDLCSDIKDSSNPVQFNNFETSLYASCLRSPFVLATIQWPGKSEIFHHNLSEISKSLYPEDPFDLFNMLLENVRKVFSPLTFLRSQCDRDKNLAGWRDCAYGQSCMETLKKSLKSSHPATSCCASWDSPGHGLLCTNDTVHSNVHQHCTSSKPEVKCIGSNGQCNQSTSGTADDHTQGQCKESCPHPLLMFLLDGSLGSKSQDSYSLFRLPSGSFVTRMGFKAEHLPSPGKSGNDIKDVLKEFCDSSSSSLTRLVKFLTCISRTPPETLGEFFAFFKVFVPKLTSTFESYASKEPGTPDGSALKKAIQGLYDSQGRHPKGNHSSPKSGSSHSADLYSLTNCHATIGSGASCAAYLNLLTGDVYDIFIDKFVDTYLSWICYLPEMFREKVEEFRKKFSLCCSSGSSCKSIVTCPCALPLISSQGFQFMSPLGLGCWDNSGNEHKKRQGEVKHTGGDGAPDCTRRTCKDFITQLGLVVDSESPLQALLNAIEKFLWSIRLPFFFGFLYVWFCVLSYFCYVILIKLDTFHTGSHLHLPRSFKILPSTLFSDGSSKLKDLSYFTL